MFPRALIDTFDPDTLPPDNLKITMWKPPSDTRPFRLTARVHALAVVVAQAGVGTDFIEQSLVQSYWRDRELFYRHWDQYMEDLPQGKD